MIIWLASYPKSGNTWIRTIIGQVINNNFDRNEVFKEAKNIELYPSKKFFFDLDNDFNLSVFPNEKKKIIFKKTALNWDISQTRLNINEDIKIFKTHNMLCKFTIEGKSCSFTDLNNSLGVIHIVRDPRNVFTSLKNHFSIKDDDTAFKFITNDNQSIGLDENYIPQLLSSWKNHYKSWKRYPKNNLLIRYEDLIQDAKNEFTKIANFIGGLLKLKFNEDQIDTAINLSSFEKLEKMEKKDGFAESNIGKDGNKNKFFFLGPKNNWRKILDYEISRDIEKEFEKEMKELKYI